MVINKKDKHGWTTVIEVFISILLISGIISAIAIANSVQKPKISEQIYESQSSVLKTIQINDNLRAEVLSGQLTVGINNTIIQVTPNYLECKAKICDFPNECNLDPEAIPEEEIFVKSVLITEDKVNYNPKELKLFCWEK